MSQLYSLHILHLQFGPESILVYLRQLIRVTQHYPGLSPSSTPHHSTLIRGLYKTSMETFLNDYLIYIFFLSSVPYVSIKVPKKKKGK